MALLKKRKKKGEVEYIYLSGYVYMWCGGWVRDYSSSQITLVVASL